MKLLELFSGQGSISKYFSSQGHEVYRVDWSDKVDADLHVDVSKLTIKDIIQLCDGIPDVIWASPQCTTYSIATHKHRTLKENLLPKTKLAKDDDKTNVALWKLIDSLLAHGTKYYFVENPKGRMRHMSFVKNRPRYTITYCSYGRKGNANGFENVYQKKPTDIWTNHPTPKFKKECNNEHEHGDWSYSAKRDYLNRGNIPINLIKHIEKIVRKE